MTPEQEARAADIAMQVALAKIGADALEDAIELWRYLDPKRAAETAESWLEAAVRLILLRRRLSRDLAMAYYRLVRALRTGKTIADPFKPDPPYVTIDMLRREFADLIADVDETTGPEGEEEQAALDEDTLLLDEEPADEDEDADEDIDESDRIEVEDIPYLREDEIEDERYAEEFAREDLQTLGPDALEALESDDAEVIDLAERQAATNVAATAERHVLNGGRATVYQYARKDSRALGWARVSLSGDPCHFCAMLISRGAVYKSEAAASDGPKTTVRDGQELDAYHDNCRCVAVPVYSKSQYETDPRFDQNRILAKLWKKGMSLQEWRRFLDAGKAEGNTPWIITPTQEDQVQVA